MYLVRKSYITGVYDVKTDTFNTGVSIFGIPLLPGGKVNEVSEQAAYWRKANHIHNWFIENVMGGEDDCRSHEVSLEDLQNLIDTCKEVLANKERAEELLPCVRGFFFGSTEYDDYYFESLQDTINQLESIITFEKDSFEQNNAERIPGVFVYYEYLGSW